MIFLQEKCPKCFGGCIHQDGEKFTSGFIGNVVCGDTGDISVWKEVCTRVIEVDLSNLQETLAVIQRSVCSRAILQNSDGSLWAFMRVDNRMVGPYATLRDLRGIIREN